MNKFMTLVLFTIGLGISFNGCSNQANVAHQGVLKNDSKVVHPYKKACDSGDILACAELGTMYMYGRGGVQKNDSKAIELFKKACDGGDSLACMYSRNL